MKRRIGMLLAALLLLSLAGCGSPAGISPTVIATADPAEGTTESVFATAAAEMAASAEGVVTVSTVEELIGAIGSDREIRLPEGTFDLTGAESYGKDTGNPLVSWEETFDGYELVIRGVKNLAIVGAGKGVTMVCTQPRYANVLRFEGCGNLFLSGITAGHAPEPGACIGGVVALQACDVVSLRDLGLYGCGTIGVDATGVKQLHITSCDIYDCSQSGIQLSGCQDVLVDNCSVYDLGEAEWEAEAAVSLYSTYDVSIQNCRIHDNRVRYLVSSFGVDNVRVRNNDFRDNRLLEAAFGTFGNFVTLDGNFFQEGMVSRWFGEDCGALDAEGNTLDDYAMGGGTREPVEEPAEKTSVTVTNVDEFLAAIAPNTEIVLDGKEFDLSTAADYGGGPKRYYYWEDNFDGPGLVISGVDNLTIRSKSQNRASCTIAAVPRYANVLSFWGCRNLVLSGFTAGHTTQPGECSGGVLFLDNCEMVTIGNCGMYGCGILGVQASSCTGITMDNCEIYECSYGGVQMLDVTGLVMNQCTFRDLGGNNLQLEGCSDVVVDGQPLSGQHYDGR